MKKQGLIILLGAALFPFSAGAAGPQAKDYALITIDEENFNPASRCGECHIDIYALWNQSMHSKALSDPAFLATFEDERIQQDEAVRGYCIQCHAPTLHYNPDLTWDSQVVQEGVTCDFCHSIRSLIPESPGRIFNVKWGRMKHGPMDNAYSPIHDTKQSSLFTSGDLCGGCHEMSNLKGLPIITTYSEWKEGYYKESEDVNCQNCHMPLAAGFTVSKKLRKTKRRINLHSFPGGHSRVQLLDALKFEILEESKTYGKMKVKLGITNVGAGHYIPTGNPLRSVVVDFRAFNSSNEPIFNQQIELARRFADADGNILTTDLSILLDATEIVDDNRIAPGETKELIFEFLAPNEKLLVEAIVTYVYNNRAFPELYREEKLITYTKVVNKEPLSSKR